jgi:serine/threonine protein kinase
MDHISFVENSTASYEDLLLNGPPSPPLQFGTPRTGRAERVDAPVLNPITQEILEVSNIIYERHSDERPPERAYWVGRKLKKCIFGVVKECTLLRFRNDRHVPWEVTAGKAAVKIMSWQKIRELQHIEDPIKEVAAMQYVSSVFGSPHPHVMGVLDVLQDDDYLLMFMPFCSSGDLFGFVQQAGKFPEPMARYWFRQILEVRIACLVYSFLACFQTKKVSRYKELKPRHNEDERMIYIFLSSLINSFDLHESPCFIHFCAL